MAIKEIEDEHFQGQKIALNNCDYGDSVWSYFQSELNSNLNIIKLKVNQFKTNKSIDNFISSNGKVNNDVLNYEQDVI